MSTIHDTIILTGIVIGNYSGDYASPLTITGSGAVAPASGNAVFSNLTGASLANYGTISATSGLGVYLYVGGIVTNGTGGLIQGSDVGVAIGYYGVASTVAN